MKKQDIEMIQPPLTEILTKIAKFLSGSKLNHSDGIHESVKNSNQEAI